jgi:ATP-binding cassette, subfamily B, bacterial MsbA
LIAIRNPQSTIRNCWYNRLMTDLHKLLPYIRSHFPLLALALVLLVSSAVLEGITILLLQPIFDQLAAAETPETGIFAQLSNYLNLGRRSFAQIAVYLLAFSLLKGLFLYFAEFSMSYSGQHVVATIRKRLYAHLLDQSLGFYARNSTGKLMARVITDTERIQETVSKTMTDFARQSFLLIIFLGLAFAIDWKLSLLSFLVAPVVLHITLKLGKRIRKASWRSQENLAQISQNLQETIVGQRIVKAFGMEDYERRRFNQATDDLFKVNLRVARISALNSPLIEFVGYASFVPFLLYAHYQMGRGFSVGAFVAFVAILFRLYEPVRKLSRMHLHFQQAFASSSRIFELLETEVEIKESPQARELAPFRREVRFENVSFCYGDQTDVPVLRDIDLTVEAGEIVALVGKSGAGKTTLASLIPRFYDATSGRLTIDGCDVREFTLRSLRRQIAIVTQDTFLFDDTVRNNIAYGRANRSLEEIVEAAKAAFIHDFVESLPDGYDTIIGERGQRLSGGQRQRLAIARAILKDAPILILDEATSSLDTESERLVQAALYNLMERRTTLVIAHRLSTVRRADRIVVMDQGRIVETGSHQALMEQPGYYRRLYELQFADIVAAR